jgi:ABC-type Fe3+ transport system substrate-binding protein
MQEDISMTEPSPVSKKRRLKLTDALIILVFIVIIAFLAVTLAKQLALRHEASSARTTSDKLITAMQAQDGARARQLGDASFQAQHSPAQLAGLFKQSKPYTAGTPTVVKQTVNNGKVAHVVSTYYKFNAKKPFYVRVTVVEPNGKTTWQVINFSGDTSLASLEK